MVVAEINGKKLYLDNRLKAKLDNVKMIMRKGWDCIGLVDGIEGSGKSTLSFVCGWYISDGKITMHNICEGTEDAMKKLEKLEDGSVLIIDEGSLMFSSKDTMRKEQKHLIKILQVIRQKKMCLLIVSPSFFDLNKYIAVNRSRFLLHVYTDKDLTRGRFAYFSERKKHRLYVMGKKNYNSYAKPKSDFVGRYTNFDPFGEEYQKLKRKSLFEAFHEKPRGDIPDELRQKIKKEVIVELSNKLPIQTHTELAEKSDITRKTLYNWRKSLENEQRKGKENNILNIPY